MDVKLEWSLLISSLNGYFLKKVGMSLKERYYLFVFKGIKY